jgi:glycosyltransferase involved in cell wall biosynthesis
VKVLLVGNFLSATTGARTVCEDLALRLPDVGVEVVTSSAQPSRALRLADMVATTWRRRADYDAAVVDVFSGPAFVWAEATCATLAAVRRPFVLVVRGGALPDFAARWPRRVRRLLRRATAVVAPSPFLAGALRAFRADIAVVPNPVDTDACAFRLREAPAPRLVWLRAFHALYRPELAVRVLEALRQLPGASLTLVGRDKGDGSLARTRALVADLGLSDRVEVVGPVPKGAVPGQLARGDVFLNTASVDNAPVSVVEALACGLPVVSTRVGGIPDLLTHERDALLVPADDVEAMAGAVRRLLHEPGLAGRLSSGGRALAEAHSWPVVLTRWSTLLHEVTTDGARAS